MLVIGYIDVVLQSESADELPPRRRAPYTTSSVQVRKLNFNFSNRRRSTRVSDIARRKGQDIIEHVQWSYVGVELQSE